MPNKLTVTFQPCSGANSYIMHYRLKGSSEPYKASGSVHNSPLSAYITDDPDGSEYEGYIQAICISIGNVSFGQRVYFTTQAGVNSLEVSVANGIGTVCSGDGLDLVYYTGSFGNGTVIYSDNTLQTKYNNFSFISTGGIIYQVNLATGVITNVGSC